LIIQGIAKGVGMKKIICIIIILLWVSVSFAWDDTMRYWHSKPLKYRVELANVYIQKVTGKKNMAEAKALELCMREATIDPKLYVYKVDDIAAACLVMMGYR